MRRRFKALAAVSLCCLLLAGCSCPPSLAQRAVVKLICVAGQPGGYRAVLVAYTAASGGGDGPEGEGEGESETLIVCGQGASLPDALQNAQQGMRQQAFYAQNELLLIEEGAAQADLQGILQYFSQERSSRPNMAVFLYQGNQLEDWLTEQTAHQAVEELEQLKNGEGQQPVLVQQIYHFDLQGQALQLIPRLKLAGGQPLQTDALVFLPPGQAAFSLEGEEKRLAELLLGAGESYWYRQQGTLWEIAEIRITPVVEDAGGGRLQLRLCGVLKNPPAGGDPQQAAAEAAEHLRQLFAAVYDRCYLQRQTDPFRLGWWFQAQDAARYTPLLRAKALFTPERVKFTAEIKTEP